MKMKKIKLLAISAIALTSLTVCMENSNVTYASVSDNQDTTSEDANVSDNQDTTSKDANVSDNQDTTTLDLKNGNLNTGLNDSKVVWSWERNEKEYIKNPNASYRDFGPFFSTETGSYVLDYKQGRKEIKRTSIWNVTQTGEITANGEIPGTGTSLGIKASKSVSQGVQSEEIYQVDPNVLTALATKVLYDVESGTVRSKLYNLFGENYATYEYPYTMWTPITTETRLLTKPL